MTLSPAIVPVFGLVADEAGRGKKGQLVSHQLQLERAHRSSCEHTGSTHWHGGEHE